MPAGAASVAFKMGTKLAPEANTALWNLELLAALALAHVGLVPPSLCDFSHLATRSTSPSNEADRSSPGYSRTL